MLKLDLKTAGPFIALVVVFIIGVLVNDAFLSSSNLSNILARSSFIGIVAIGATFVITAGGIDLSVGSMAAFISGCMILLMNALMDPIDSMVAIIILALIASLGIGAAAGLINEQYESRTYTRCDPAGMSWQACARWRPCDHSERHLCHDHAVCRR